MVRKFLVGAGLIASVLGGGAAQAADMSMPVKAPVYKAPVYLSEWAGFYIGGHGGYGFGSTSVDRPAIPDLCDLGIFKPQIGSLDASPKGSVFGAQAGYNWQYGSIVTGLEVDYSAADISDSGNVGSFFTFGEDRRVPGTFSRTVKFDELATARARLGYTVLPSLLAYGTAGLAWGHSEFTGAASIPGQSISASSDANNFGWTAGAGLEYMLWNHWLVRGEYLHYDFAKTTYSMPVVGGINATSTIDVVRGGLSYKF